VPMPMITVIATVQQARRYIYSADQILTIS